MCPGFLGKEHVSNNHEDKKNWNFYFFYSHAFFLMFEAYQGYGYNLYCNSVMCANGNIRESRTGGRSMSMESDIPAVTTNTAGCQALVMLRESVGASDAGDFPNQSHIRK